MARLLVKAVDSASPDQAASYDRGDTVVVMEDSHEWGGMEGLPEFLQLDVSGASVSDLLYLTDPQEAQQNESMSLATRKIQRMFLVLNRNQDKAKNIKNSRRFKVDVDSISFTNGKATVSNVSPEDKRKLK